MQDFLQKNLCIRFFFRTFAVKMTNGHMKKTFLLLFTALMGVGMYAQEKQRYVGGDISMLPQYEQYSSGYKDVNNRKINDLITWFISDCGWNTFRVRIFVHPNQKAPDYKTTDYAICQDLAYVTKLGKRIKDAGAYFMLDFHYSDSWVDAGHIQAPAAWKGAKDSVMADSIATYTRYVLENLIAAGAKPDLVQVGNEIMYGLCGIQVHPYDKEGDNWEGYLGLLRAGCNTVRELCPEAKIIIHTDRPSNPSYNFYFYNKLRNNGVDYDVIGLSYYPFWHGYLTPEQVKNKSNKENLTSALTYLQSQFPEKEVQLVECAYNFQYWPTKGVNVDTQDAWPCSKAGQYAFVKDVVDALKPIDQVTGINYWFPEDAGNGDYVNWETKAGLVEEEWSNRGFWNENSTTSGHTINRTGAPTAEQTAADVCAPYYLGTFLPQKEEAIEETLSSAAKAVKTFQDGQIVIERNGHRFNALGQAL